MLVSAYWHGIHAGYYLSFLTIPVCLLTEDLLMSLLHRHSPSPTQKRLVEWFIWFMKMRAFDYMSMGFLLLTLHKTVGYWSSVYFVGHVWSAFFIVVCLVYKTLRIYTPSLIPHKRST